MDLMLEATPEFFGDCTADDGQAMVLLVPSVHAVAAGPPWLGSR